MTFEARIIEHFSRRIVVEANNPDEAEEIIENLCSDGVIDLCYEDFNEREIEILGSIVRASKPYLELYDDSGKIG